MQDTVKLKRHAALFDNMGSAIGLDLQKQAIGGDLPIEEISEAVLRCVACSRPDHCAKLLASPGLQAQLQIRDIRASQLRNYTIFRRKYTIFQFSGSTKP